MPLRLHIQLDLQPARTALQQIRKHIPEVRRHLTEHVAREVLRRTIQHNPVDSGRSRSAWVAALEQLAGTPPEDWQGSRPQAAAIHEGRTASQLQRHDAPTTTSIRITNQVDYIACLEYGTRQQPPQAMSRRAIQEALQLIPQLTKSLLDAL